MKENIFLKGYTGESYMDCGFFMGGDKDHLLWFPTKEMKEYNDGKPYAIPYEELLGEATEEITMEDHLDHREKRLE